MTEPVRGQILIVDDAAEIRVLLRGILSKLNAEIFEAVDGREAYELLQRSSVDLVVSDIQMPEMDGLELLYRIRDEGSEVPFIVVTGHGDQSKAVRALRLGAYDFIDKPFDPSSLLKRAGEALDVGLKLRELHRYMAAAKNRVSDLSADDQEVYEHLKKGLLISKIYNKVL